MFKELKKRVDRWAQVEKFEKDKDIRHALESILDRANYRALLKVFVEDGLSPGSGVSEEERRELLTCLARADRGEKVTADSLPRMTNRSGRLTIGAWLTNACRQDLSPMPAEADHVVPISCHCDDDTGRVIASTFAALGYSRDASQLGQLKQVAEKAHGRVWAEALPFVIGPCFVSCGSTLSFSDALLLPRTGMMFLLRPSLAALYLPTCSTIIIRTAALRAMAGAGFLRLPIGSPLPATEVEHQMRADYQMRAAGYTVESIR